MEAQALEAKGAVMEDVREAYLKALRAYRVAQDRADAAFVRWFEKQRDGQPTNAAAATRLANEANYRSADLAAAENDVWEQDIIEPSEVARQAGLDEDGRPLEAVA